MVQRITVSEPLLDYDCELGEGSLWDERRQRLYFIDILGRRIYTYDPSSGLHGYQSFDKKPTALALLEDDSGLLVSLEDGPAFIPFESLPFPPTNTTSTYQRLNLKIPPMPGFNRFNEACVDPTGKRWMLGSMMHEENWPGGNGGALYSVEVDANNEMTVSLKLNDITVANGMGWSQENKTMFFTDSLRREIGSYDYDLSTGELSRKGTYSQLDEKTLGVPDGLCQDTNYAIWSARWGSGQVIRLDERGQPDLIVDFPTSLNMTSCIFGGPNMDDLFVTSAAPETSELAEKYPHSGRLFVVKGLRCKGRERTRFKGTFK